MPGRAEWARVDLLDGDPEPAVRGVDAIIHLASGKTAGDEDVIATRRLLAAAAAASVRHVVAVSIIGCDRIPLPFYAVKRRVEEAVRSSGVPWTIVRVAQFHSFVERLVAAAGALPIPAPIVGDLRFQPVDEREAAERLVALALGPALGDAPEVAGPAVVTLRELAATWLSVTGAPATLLPVPVSALAGEDAGPPVPAPWVRGVLEGYRAAWNTPRGERTLGTVTFGEWLRRRRGAGRGPADHRHRQRSRP